MFRLVPVLGLLVSASSFAAGGYTQVDLKCICLELTMGSNTPHQFQPTSRKYELSPQAKRYVDDFPKENLKNVNLDLIVDAMAREGGIFSELELRHLGAKDQYEALRDFEASCKKLERRLSVIGCGIRGELLQ